MTRSLAVLSLLAALILPATASAVPQPQDRYIVVLNDGVDSQEVAREHGNKYGVQNRLVYGAAINGYAGKVPPGQLAKIQSDPRVKYVEPDGVAYATATTRSNATWGLDRIDQRALPLRTTFTYSNTGSGVTAYVIDTGIRFSHSQFGGRATSLYDAVDGGSADDCNGHGTHVAGTIGGSTYGVASGVSLKAVRVLDCSGSGLWSGVIAGINQVTLDHGSGPAVANMSLGGGASSSVDTAVRNSILDGVSYAIAAGNGNQGGKEQDACKYSPARVTEAMTIGATDKTDTKARWSNYGPCVDWFAPGVSIMSAWYSSDTATNTISGTSMATPHTAGVAALYLQGSPTASPGAVRDALYANTTKNVVKSSKTTNAHLLYTNY